MSFESFDEKGIKVPKNVKNYYEEILTEIGEDSDRDG